MNEHRVVINKSSYNTSASKQDLLQDNVRLAKDNKLIVRVLEINPIGVDWCHPKYGRIVFTLDEHPDHIIKGKYVLEFIIVTQIKIHKVTIYHTIKYSNTIDDAVANLVNWCKYNLMEKNIKIYLIIPKPSYCK